MSLSTRVIAALGAVVVIGAGTLGGSIAYASGQPKPIATKATVTIGRSSQEFTPDPVCYNGGKPLDAAANQACAAFSNQPAQFRKLSIKTSDQIGVGLDPDSAKNGWRAYTNGGGGQGTATIANYQKTSTFSGLVPAVNVLTQVRDTTLTIIEFDPKTADSAKPGIIAVWFLDLQNDAAPVGQQQSQDASQGQDPSQGQ
ncbi:hypothetical protein OG500_21830 [Kitasatospora sp. NBC_01250]|uniref:hypothetical protein n=1 Tax=unclassified Kitasatospora TaxID=2633591 RepID=UPI002E162F5D|nr:MULTISPECIES: hypothetical protein [unclassified Kitasatospora]WSJ68694.1 hypothetical protein OG294_22675 [Kitasatospora sp. NBC_01302]